MEFNIEQHTNFLAVTGSRAYGTFTETSDIDLRGIATPPDDYFLSFHKNFEQYDEKCVPEEYPFWRQIQIYCRKNRIDEGIILSEPLDQAIYSLKKFFHLAMKANPNIIEILFADSDDILVMDDVGKILRENKDLFLSAKAKFTFSGYAIAQLKRIKTHRRWLLNPIEKEPTRADFGLPNKGAIPRDHRGAAEKLVEKFVREWLLLEDDLDKKVVEDIHIRLEDFLESALKVQDLDLTQVARVAAMKDLGMSKNYIELLQAEKAYRQARNEYKQYQEWKENRNPERAKMEKEFGLDLKHASHLVRLLRMAKEILTEGKVIVKRPDAEELKAIRSGAWSYDDLIQWAKEKDDELHKLYTEGKYVVPKAPNVKELDFLYKRCCNVAFDKDKINKFFDQETKND